MNGKLEVNPYVSFVLDMETSVYNKEHRGFDASPFHKPNEIEAICICRIEADPEGREPSRSEIWGTECTRAGKFISHGDPIWKTMPRYMVGHNVIFDYMYARRGAENFKSIGADDAPLVQLVDGVRNGDTLLWDTMLVEYLLSGQKDSMLSLEAVGEKYGITTPKMTEVTELWEAGIDTCDIDADLLCDRVESDVEITKEVYLNQLERVIEADMLPFVLQQLRSLAVIAEYTWNGMKIDNEELARIKNEADTVKAKAEFEILDCALTLIRKSMHAAMLSGGIEWSHLPSPAKEPEDFDSIDHQLANATWQFAHEAVSSTDKLKQLVYGNKEFELDVQLNSGEYKSGAKKGQPRYSNCKLQFPIEAKFLPAVLPSEHMTDTGKKMSAHKAPALLFTYKECKLDDGAIDFLLGCESIKRCIHTEGLLRELAEYRDASKIKDTFCKGIEEYQYDGELIHGNLLTCRTPTGRLTSAEPNLQNIPSNSASEIKTLFVSRFENGVVAAVDFKQLEVIALAWKTGDPVLIDDILNGRDIHFETGKQVFGWKKPENAPDDLRKKIKRVNFGIIYGAGANTVGQGLDLTEGEVKELVAALKSRYNTAFSNAYRDNLIKELNLSAVRTGEFDNGKTQHTGYIVQPTGRRIAVDQVENKFGHRSLTIDWPFTKLRNYPIQSLAYDIVSLARIMFLDKILAYDMDDKIKMINEVHDEIVFDLKSEHYVPILERITEEVSQEINDELMAVFNLDTPMNLPLTLSFGWGENWKGAK